ncbi:macrosialin [Nothobranchius furzeri]|nr:macrosialin [Nothobranchius furzeri]XP_054589728.1 macrosialin [Nothobranchius furzeri]KAF7207341.1 CD68 molecule [Nothobranchius furzeri]
MQRAVVLIFMACCALSALSLAKEKYKPSSSMAPAHGFTNVPTTTKIPKPPTTTTTTATTPPKSTKATTTTATTVTTTPKTTNATTTTATTITTTPTTTNATTTTATTITTTPISTTTAPTPTPPTNVTVGNYTVLTSDGKLCLMATMAIQIQLVSQKATGNFTIQPKQTSASGHCSNSKPNADLTLTFKQGSITFHFNKSVADGTVFVDSLSFSVNYPLTNAGISAGHTPYTASNSSLHLFSAKIGHSYSCKTESIYMGNNLYLSVEKNKMQAFNFSSNDFGKPDPCPADRSDYSVAIAVGVTLLVLIVIVLVVYLLGRRRRAAGYQSL